MESLKLTEDAFCRFLACRRLYDVGVRADLHPGKKKGKNYRREHSGQSLHQSSKPGVMRQVAFQLELKSIGHLKMRKFLGTLFIAIKMPGPTSIPSVASAEP